MDFSEKRQEYRLDSEEIVFIELAAAAPDGSEPARIVVATCIDISANGIQVLSDQPLTQGAILPVCVQLDQPEVRLHVTCEVMWCRSQADDLGYAIGLSIFESQGTDVQKWKEVIVQRCES